MAIYLRLKKIFLLWDVWFNRERGLIVQDMYSKLSLAAHNVYINLQQKNKNSQKTELIIDSAVCYYKPDIHSTTDSMLEKGNHTREHTSPFSKEIDENW